MCKYIYAKLSNNTNIMVSPFMYSRGKSPLHGMIKKLHPYRRIRSHYLLNEMYIPTCTTIININDMEKS